MPPVLIVERYHENRESFLFQVCVQAGSLQQFVQDLCTFSEIQVLKVFDCFLEKGVLCGSYQWTAESEKEQTGKSKQVSKKPAFYRRVEREVWEFISHLFLILSCFHLCVQGAVDSVFSPFIQAVNFSIEEGILL